MGREPGSAPGGAVTFFRFAERKSPKKGRPQVCDPCAALRGKPASGRLRGAPWNSLCAARAARTTTASQFTKHARSDARATPQPPRRRRSHRGWTAENSRTATRVFAALDPARAAPCSRRLPPQQRAERSNGPSGCSAAHPLCMRRGAQRPADQGSRLSERSAAQRVRARPRWTRAPQVARSAAQGRRQWGRLLLPSFLGDARKEGAPPGAHPGTRPWHKQATRSASKPSPNG